MTPTEQIQLMMEDSYARYKRAVVDPSEANKYRANFYKGRFEAFREALNAINHDTRTNAETERGTQEGAD
jgi:hypothetical protein